MQAAQPTTRRGRKYPFKARNANERGEITQMVSVALSGIENMVYDLARQILPPGLTDDDVTESVQLCMIHLWRRSMPKYNAWRGVKISTFLHTCTSNYMKQLRRGMLKKGVKAQILSQVGGHQGTGLAAPDTSLDNRIEALSLDILNYPEKYMTPVQADVFRALVDNPNMMMKDLASDLDYARPSSLSMIKRRIRERLLEVDIEDFFAPAHDGPANSALGGRPALRAG